MGYQWAESLNIIVLPVQEYGRLVKFSEENPDMGFENQRTPRTPWNYLVLRPGYSLGRVCLISPIVHYVSIHPETPLAEILKEKELPRGP